MLTGSRCRQSPSTPSRQPLPSRSFRSFCSVSPWLSSLSLPLSFPLFFSFFRIGRLHTAFSARTRASARPRVSYAHGNNATKEPNEKFIATFPRSIRRSRLQPVRRRRIFQVIFQTLRDKGGNFSMDNRFEETVRRVAETFNEAKYPVGEGNACARRCKDQAMIFAQFQRDAVCRSARSSERHHRVRCNSLTTRKTRSTFCRIYLVSLSALFSPSINDLRKTLETQRLSTRCVDRGPVGWRNSESREAKESVPVAAATEEDDAPLGRPLLAFLALPSGPASPLRCEASCCSCLRAPTQPPPYPRPRPLYNVRSASEMNGKTATNISWDALILQRLISRMYRGNIMLRYR